MVRPKAGRLVCYLDAQAPFWGGVETQGRPFTEWLDIKSHLALKDSQEQME